MQTLLFFVLTASAALADAQSLAVVNAKIWTGTDAPWAEALLVDHGRIRTIGTSETVVRAAPEGTRFIDAAGKMIVPGFIDSHIHPVAIRRREHPPVFLAGVRSRAEFVERISTYARNVPKGTWILSADWNELRWGGELPSRQWVDAVTPEHPVWLTRSDMKLGLANSVALRKAGIGSRTEQRRGIRRDVRGEPTGIVEGAAMMLLDRAVLAESAAEDDRTLDNTMRYLNRLGITSVHDLSYNWAPFIVWERARRQGRLTVRVYCAAPLPAWERLAEYVAQNGRGDEWFRIGLLKGYSMGWSPAASPRRPRDMQQPANFYDWISAAAKAGFQVRSHGTDDVLVDILERVRSEQSIADPRFGSEHGHRYLPGSMDKYPAAGVFASMQPRFELEPDMRNIREQDAARWARMFPYTQLLDRGVVLAFGTDGNTTPESPLDVMATALAHEPPAGVRPLNIYEALRAYTWGGAYGSFEENEKGTLAPGKLADFVMLDTDITRIRPAQLRSVQVLMTVVGGRVVYQRP